MKYATPTENERHLRVYENRSEYHSESGQAETFAEGVISTSAKRRLKKIRNALADGYLDSLIENVRMRKVEVDSQKVSKAARQSLRELLALMTSEVGRALIGLSVMQLTIKSIAPDQNIRLHKGSSNRSAFSWVDGISMRSLDKNFVTPVLRRHGLLRLNADGFMMTRSLAENYPYSLLYKAHLRGAKDQWLSLVEELESGSTEALESLKFFLSLLLNAAEDFNKRANEMVSNLEIVEGKLAKRSDAISLMAGHFERSDYAARLLEVSMHALMQAAVETGALGDLTVTPLSQMRSANKKHGNIGDVELVEHGEIVESWDAKYGKAYLREEIEEVFEKLSEHEFVETVGFVTNVRIERSEELDRRIADITALHSVTIRIVSYSEWVDEVFGRCLETRLADEEQLTQQWVRAYTESLAQKRREVAPIDEPCEEWVRSFTTLLGEL